jgi:hypothetical protein
LERRRSNVAELIPRSRHKSLTGTSGLGPLGPLQKPDNRMLAVLALAHDDLLARTVTMPRFQLFVGLIYGKGTTATRGSFKIRSIDDLCTLMANSP